MKKKLGNFLAARNYVAVWNEEYLEECYYLPIHSRTVVFERYNIYILVFERYNISLKYEKYYVDKDNICYTYISLVDLRRDLLRAVGKEIRFLHAKKSRSVKNIYRTSL